MIRCNSQTEGHKKLSAHQNLMHVINYLDISLDEASAMHCVLPFFLWQHKLKMENSCSRTQILNIKNVIGVSGADLFY